MFSEIKRIQYKIEKMLRKTYPSRYSQLYTDSWVKVVSSLTSIALDFQVKQQPSIYILLCRDADFKIFQHQ